jgi:transcription elongation GreA/GreB family factor
MLNKSKLVAAVVAQLEAELDRQVTAANSSRAEATDPDSKAEGKFDMRGQSAAYLAEGQAELAAGIAAALTAWKAMPLRAFGPSDGVALGAVVTVETSGRRAVYLIGPSSGGTEVQVGGEGVVVVTPASPLGRQLLGRKFGHRFTPQGRAASGASVVTAVA